MIFFSELFSQMNCIEPYFGYTKHPFLKRVIKLPIFISFNNNIQERWFMVWYGDRSNFYVLCCEAACEIIEKTYS